MSTQPHLLVSDGDLPEIALLPGDPDRVDRIAERCHDVTRHARNREYKVVSAVYESTPVTICSTGIGCPSAAIALEELANVGVETVIRVGTTGALQAPFDIGDCIVATGAAKNEGTTERYEAIEYPAVPDHEVLSGLVTAADASGWPVHIGPIVTDDAFYAETDEYVADWERAGLLAVEMEAAAIFTLARRRGLRAGAICTVDGNLVRGTQKGVDTDDTELPEGAQGGVDRAIDIALKTVEAL